MIEEEKSLPTCVGFIMDGNRRFAKEKGRPELEGHQAGKKKFLGELEAREKRSGAFNVFVS